jgi:cytochrome c oxidase assembly protein subunit 11
MDDRRSLALKLAVGAVAMFGFGYALVPLYDVFCDLTGLGGRTAGAAVAPLEQAADRDRLVRVEFLATKGRLAHWDFAPESSHMYVHPGQLYQTHYVAHNRADASRQAHAVPSVAPGTAAQHMKKTQCFCFETQHFEANEQREMPVVFMIAPELPAHVSTLTLAYTFFDTTE